MIVEYPKWVYPVGIKEVYEPGQEPVLVKNAEQEAALTEAEKPRRGRPPKVAEAE